MDGTPSPPAWPGRRVRFADLLVARDETPAPIEAGVRVLDEDMKTDPAPRLAHDPVAATGSRHQEIPRAPATSEHGARERGLDWMTTR